MTHMKGLLFMLSLSLLVSISVFAGKQQSSDEDRVAKMNARLENLKTNLSLNEEQFKAIKLIFVDEDQSLDVVRKTVVGDRELKKKQFELIKTETEQKLIKELSPEQLVKYNAIKETNKQEKVNKAPNTETQQKSEKKNK